MWFLTLIAGIALADEVRVTVDLADLLADRTPALVGAGLLTACMGRSASLADLQRHLSLAEGALPLLDLDAAEQALDAANRVLGCLDEAVAGSLAARVAFLSGLVAVLGEQPVEAQDHFAAALVLRPSLEWDDNWAPDLRKPYEAARAALAAQSPAVVTILGSPDPGTLWLDGRPLTLHAGGQEIPGGRHYLQLAGDPWQTWTLDLQAGTVATLVVPGALGPEALAWALDPDQQHRLDPLLALVVAPGSELQLHALNTDYTVEPTNQAWVEVTAEKHPGRWVALGGGALAAGAAMVGTLAWIDAKQAVAGADSAQGWSDYLEADVSYQQAKSRYRTAWIGEGVGLAVLGAGLVVEWRFGAKP
jgi:hypothetical protein